MTGTSLTFSSVRSISLPSRTHSLLQSRASLCSSIPRWPGTSWLQVLRLRRTTSSILTSSSSHSSEEQTMTTTADMRFLQQYVPTVRQSSRRATSGASSLQQPLHGQSLTRASSRTLHGLTTSRYVTATVQQVTTTFLRMCHLSSSRPTRPSGSRWATHGGEPLQ